jgi:hypothetical protein
MCRTALGHGDTIKATEFRIFTRILSLPVPPSPCPHRAAPGHRIVGVVRAEVEMQAQSFKKERFQIKRFFSSLNLPRRKSWIPF